MPRVFLNAVYGYRRISVGVRGIGPTDRSRFYVTDRGHREKGAALPFLPPTFRTSLAASPIPLIVLRRSPLITSTGSPSLPTYAAALFLVIGLRNIRG